MIHVTQNQKIIGHEDLRVATPTGDYEDSALIEFYNVNQPDVVSGSFQAQFVAYGSLVYRCSGHIELGNAILAIDPNSTHTAASYVRMSNELLAQMDEGTLEAKSLDEVIEAEQTNMEEKKVESEETPIETVDPVSDPVSDPGYELPEEEPAIPEIVEPENPDEVFENASSTTPALSDEVLPDPIVEPAQDPIPASAPDTIFEQASTTEILERTSLRKVKANSVLARAKKVVLKRKV